MSPRNLLSVYTPRRIGSCVLVALLALSALPARAQSDAGTQARQALNDGRFAEAVSILTSALAQDPDDAGMLVLRAQAYEARSRYVEAARDYERALILRPGLPAAESGLERARQTGPTSGRVTESFRRQVEANPSNLGYRLQLADALHDAGLLEEAAQQYGYLLARAQGTPDVVRRYLVVLAALGEHGRGAAEAERYLQFYTSSADLRMRLGYFRLWQGRYGAAEEAFLQALAIEPGNDEARRGLTEALGRRKAARAAPPSRPALVEQLQQQLARHPARSDVRFELIDELVRLGRHVEAFSQLQALEPAHGESDRWRERFAAVDQALPESAEVYRIDRLAYRLALDAEDTSARYALVDALVEAYRFGEAYHTLVEGGRYVAPGDARHQQRLRQVQEDRLAHVRRQEERLTARLLADPTDREAARTLAAYYPILQASGDLDGRIEEAIALYEDLLADRPDDHQVRLQFAQLLTQDRRTGAALEQLRELLRVDPDDPDHITQYLYAAVQQLPPPPESHALLQRGLDAAPDHTGLLLAAVTFYTSASFDGVDHLDLAQDYLERAERLGADARASAARREAIQQARDYRLLTSARQAAREGRFEDAIRGIESYYRVTDQPIAREVRMELAHYHYESGDRTAAARLLEQAQEEKFTPDAQLALARLFFDERDYEGALQALALVLSRTPADPQARLLYGDALREVGRYEEAEEAYRAALADDEPAIHALAYERLEFLDQVTGVVIDYGVLLAPRTDAIWAGGDNVEYRRLSPGFDAQLTAPAELPVTVSIGYRLHSFEGTDVVDPEFARPVPGYTAHQFGVGAIYDITPPVRTLAHTPAYTNRIQAEAGLYNYTFVNALSRHADARQAPFWSIRYLHQMPGLYRVSAGLRQTEGAVDLWAPIGPSIGLTLIQADIQGETRPLGELLKISARGVYNRVLHDHALFAGAQFVAFTGEQAINNGYVLDLKLGVRLASELYAGLLHNRMHYGTSSPFFFTPSEVPYQLYEAFVEYESSGAGQRPYFRVLGAIGTVAFSDGFLTRRIEADLIYPLVTNLSAGLNLRASQSSRVFDGDSSSYSIFLFTGALYIGL